MTTFTIESYIGAIPLRFGMSPNEVEAILGPSVEELPNAFGNRSELREGLTLGYDSKDNTLVEAVFSPGAQVLFQGRELFSVEDPIEFLRQFDPAPQLWVGFIIFVNLGIRLSGFHDDDESQKAIGVVKKGYWDEYIEDFEPFKWSQK